MNTRLIYVILLAVAAMTATRLSAEADTYYDRKVSLFELLPVYPDDIVFLGNSITDGGEFAELFGMPNIKNRGISSDVMSGVEKRLDQIMRGKPAKLFLLIGINDVAHKLTVRQLAERYDALVQRIRTLSPETKIYLQSVMPVNNDFKRYKTLYGKERTIREFNDEIRLIAAEENCTYIDLTDALADPTTGKLRHEFTNDGLHLTGAGYRAWIEVLNPYVKE